MQMKLESYKESLEEAAADEDDTAATVAVVVADPINTPVVFRAKSTCFFPKAIGHSSLLLFVSFIVPSAEEE